MRLGARGEGDIVEVGSELGWRVKPHKSCWFGYVLQGGGSEVVRWNLLPRVLTRGVMGSRLNRVCYLVPGSM